MTALTLASTTIRVSEIMPCHLFSYGLLIKLPCQASFYSVVLTMALLLKKRFQRPVSL